MESYFKEFCSRLKRESASGVIKRPVIVDQNDIYRLAYVPFEYVNTCARLVLVNTTPGPRHMRLACELTCRLLSERTPGRVIQRENKRQADLGGSTVRPNLIRMLDHFGIGSFFGLGNAAAFWGEGSQYLQTLALLPVVTTKRGLPFTGALAEILTAPVLARSFESLFLDRLSALSPDAVYLAVGRCAWEGLQHAVEQSCLRKPQLIGMLPAPTRAGSMVNYFVGELALKDMTPNDPVRHRVAWLDAARTEVEASIERLRRSGQPSEQPSSERVEVGLHSIDRGASAASR